MVAIYDASKIELVTSRHIKLGGQKLTDNEINKLMDEIISTKTPLLCPHGRPIVIKITIQELEKWFKRIV